MAVTFTSSDPNYNNATGSGSITINKATPTVSVSGGPFTYNGSAHAATVSLTGVGGVTVSGSSVVTYNGSATVPTNAGSYAVAVTFTSSDPNYNNATGSGSITINKATPTVSVSGGPFTYNGSAHAATVSVTGVGGGTVSGSSVVTYNGSATVPTNTGSYAVAVTFTSSDPNYNNATGAGSITINLAPPAAVATTPLTNESELSWDGVSGASSYQVWRSTTNNQATATEIASGIQSLTYDDATAIPGTTYNYWVVAVKGSQVSTASPPTHGAANSGPAGVTKLGPLELVSASGNTMQIGFAPATGQSFKPLLTVSGTFSYDNSIISINGTVSPDIGNLSFPLLTGSFQIPVGQTATAPNTVKDNDPSSGVKIAGLPISITGLALKPAVPGVSDAEIEVKGNISFLNTTVSAAVLITDQGLKLESGSIGLPKICFSVGTLNVMATKMSVEYDSADDQFVIQGKLSLDLFQGPSVTADLSGDGNGIIIQGKKVYLAGTLSLDDLTLPGGWGLKDATLSVNTLTNTYSGSVEVDTPWFDVGGSIEFLNGHFDDLSLSLTDLDPGIPILIPGIPIPILFLTGGSASIINLAPTATGPITLSGTLDFSILPDTKVDLPDWLGGPISCTMATVELGGSMSTDDLSGNATVTLADGLATETGTADFNFSTDTFTATGNVDLSDIGYTGSGKLTIGNGKVTLVAKGTAEIPFSVIGSWLPWHPKLPNVPLGSAGLYLNYQQSLPYAQDFLEVWGSMSVPSLFGNVTVASPVVRVGFDESVSFPSSTNLPQVDPIASATFSVPSGTPWVLLGASWTNSSADVPFEIQSPDGTIYTESNLPGNIGIIDEADNSTQVARGSAEPCFRKLDTHPA